MSEPDLIARQRRLLRDLIVRAADRARAEHAIETNYREQVDSTENEFDDARQAISKRLVADLAECEREVERQRAAIGARFKVEQDNAVRDHALARGKILEREQADKEAAQAAYQEACWETGAVLEGAKNEAEQELRDNKTRLANRIDTLNGVHQQARALLEEWKQPAKELEAAAREAVQPPGEGVPPKLSESVARAQRLLEELQELVVPRFLKGKRLPLMMLGVWLALLYPLGLLVAHQFSKETVGWVLALGIITSSLAVLAIAPLTHFVLTALARSRARRLYVPLCQVLVEAESTRVLLLERYKSEYRQQVLQAKKQHNREVRRAHAAYRRKRASIQRRRARKLPPVEERYQQQQQDSEKRRADDLQEAEDNYQRRKKQIRQLHDDELRELEARRERLLKDARDTHKAEWAALVDGWREAMTELRTGVAEINAAVAALAPSWDDAHWQSWSPPASVPPVLRLGQYRVRLDQVPKGVPAAEELRALTPELLDLPALCASPGHSSLLLQASDAGRAAAVQALQAVLFRLLTSLPPGKVRFVIVDPVGLGQNFAAFMHLADYDEMLVASRIWTETPHIEQRLADLTLHMENVIQKYLRNRYETITDYNAQAGEVAEAFRVLVVANFPTNFSPEAIRRLISITQSGPRCGVLTLVSVDTKQPLPKGFDLADLEQSCLNLAWDGQRFRWKDSDFAPYPLSLDAPPDNDFANGILGQVGEAARGAHRVEVPFEFIAPPPEQWWTGDSRLGLRVALGRAGATQRQYLELGRGTAQHALVAGKTGSGKSTLLHALITNIALLYGPDEVELYLVDFKKGVEFKTYAVHDLPHARVVAIESEREFGLSVLQRLDAELKMRGDRFRDVRAQDLNAYRQAVSSPQGEGGRMPRILLIVDEFQEFFVEDDRIAQDAAQLLDRLVRQGRAFGMHVLLGSQTLGGAYSLARSTIDQMAVRIALQCSEADAHLILSDDNSAARLLSRPGEAIYNDANGLVEGNNPFQVVWLGDSRREDYLTRIHDLAALRPPLLRESAVVFEGNAPADVARNHLLNQWLTAPLTAEPDPRRGQLAWLGEAMAINDLTAATFRRQNGSNLLIVGQQEEAALGMLATAVVSLAAQMMPAEPGAAQPARFYIVDGRQADAPTEGPLARLPEVLPQSVRLAGWREVPALITELTAEVERRQKEAGGLAPPVYLILFGLQRLRDLRRQDDDFSFMRRGEETVSPSQQFAALLREGSALGVHTLLWCDTLNNLQRALDRQAMRELTMRVVFQMNVADSSNLIDNPAASKLGLHRALFFSEEDGRLDKFRPYGLPAESWLLRVQQQLRRRVESTESIAAR